MGTATNGSWRVGAVMGVAAICTALVAGTGQALADPCDTPTVPVVSSTVPTYEPTPTYAPSTESTPPTTETMPPTTETMPPTTETTAPTTETTTTETPPTETTPSTSPAPPFDWFTLIPTLTALPTFDNPRVALRANCEKLPPNNAWIALVVLCALAIGAGLGTRAWRHRGQKFLKTHVTVASHPGVAVPLGIRPVDDPDRDHILAVIPAEVSRSTTVEEVRS